MTSPTQGVRIQITGNTRGTEAMLEALLKAVGPASTSIWLHTSIVQALQERALMRFDAEGDEAVGGQWAPLKDFTVQRRMEMGFGGAHPINVRTGEMKQWLTTNQGEVAELGLESRLSWPSQPVDQEMQDKYETAMLGKPGPPTVPRPVVGIGAADLAFALVSLSQWISQMVSGHTGAVVQDAMV